LTWDHRWISEWILSTEVTIIKRNLNVPKPFPAAHRPPSCVSSFSTNTAPVSPNPTPRANYLDSLQSFRLVNVESTVQAYRRGLSALVWKAISQIKIAWLKHCLWKAPCISSPTCQLADVNPTLFGQCSIRRDADMFAMIRFVGQLVILPRER